MSINTLHKGDDDDDDDDNNNNNNNNDVLVHSMEYWVYVICELLAPAALSARGSAACTDCVGGGGGCLGTPSPTGPGGGVLK